MEHVSSRARNILSAVTDGRSELIIRCKERQIELAVLPSGLFALESGTVLLQINDGPPVTASWSASSNSKGLFASNAIALIKRLPEGRGPCYVAGRDQCGAMASSFGFASRKTTRPFFM
jgi:hypothetical protein